jgi:hypothetical protein
MEHEELRKLIGLNPNDSLTFWLNAVFADADALAAKKDGLVIFDFIGIVMRRHGRKIVSKSDIDLAIEMYRRYTFGHVPPTTIYNPLVEFRAVIETQPVKHLRANQILTRWASWIPRRQREVIAGDLLEDIQEYHSEGWTEKQLVWHVRRQILIAASVAILRFAKPAAWLGALRILLKSVVQ